jgi:hypothetical protein
MQEPDFEKGQILRRTDTRLFLNTVAGMRQAHNWLVKCAIFFASRMHNPPPASLKDLTCCKVDERKVQELVSALMEGPKPFLTHYSNLSKGTTYVHFKNRLKAEMRRKEGVSMKILADLVECVGISNGMLDSCKINNSSFIKCVLDQLKRLDGVFPFSSCGGEWCWIWLHQTNEMKFSKTTCIVNLILTDTGKKLLLAKYEGPGLTYDLL